ncbi:hypothetical protein Tco_1027228, partial [Tanacetum coccineum]
LESTYDKIDDSVIFNLLQKINNVKQGGCFVADYYHRLNYFKELVLHQQHMKLMQFLMGIDYCYQPIKSTILIMDPLPKVKYAYTTVAREESYKGVPESFAAKSFNNNMRIFNNNIKGSCRPSFFNGANQHLTVSIVGMFNVVDITSLNITFGHPNRTLATINHVGNIKLTNTVILYDVLVVPGYYDLPEKEKTLGIGSDSGGLYLFDIINDCSVGKCNMVMCFNVCKLLWHNRLGYLDGQVFFVLHNDVKISKSFSMPSYEVYHRAK